MAEVRLVIVTGLFEANAQSRDRSLNLLGSDAPWAEGVTY